MAARKSVLYLNSVIPVKNSYDEVVQKYLKPGKFVLTITGFIKIAGILCLAAGLGLASSTQFCGHHSNSRTAYLACTAATVGCSLILYLLFSVGCTVKRPTIWVVMDIGINLILAILTIVASVISIGGCRNLATVQKVPGPLGIAGSILVIFGCASLFLLYRYREEEDDERDFEQSVPTHILSRKSIFA